MIAVLSKPRALRAAAWGATVALGAAAHAPAAARAQEQDPALEARVWLDRGEEPVLERGTSVRVYYRTSEDAHAAIFRIDTDGLVSMVFPQHPGATELVGGGRDYRLLFPHAPVWTVDEDPGVGYFFIVASPVPLDFSAFAFDERYGWDLGVVGSVVYEDPYVAIDAYVAELIPDWDVAPYALDFLTYHVGSTYSYPRFLCYDCHTPRPYASWNPYDATCASFRVVIWDDPYFYPSYRYSGIDVVVARPVRALPRYELVTRVAGDIGVRPIVRARAAPPRSVTEFKEEPRGTAVSAPARRASAQASTALAAPARATPQQAPTRVVRPQEAPARATPQETPPRARTQEAPPRAGQQVPDSAASRPTLQRRPSARLPVRTPPSAGAPTGRGAAAPPTSTRPGAAPSPTREPASGVRGGATRATPQASPERPTRAVPSRPNSGGVAPRETPRAAPSTRPQGPSTGRATPSRPSAGAGGSARPTPRAPTTRAAPQPSRPSASPRPTPTREAAPRPTVRPRPADPD